jgi:hypothetical protein
MAPSKERIGQTIGVSRLDAAVIDDDAIHRTTFAVWQCDTDTRREQRTHEVLYFR